MKLGCRILSLLLATVLLLSALVGCASTRKPLNYFKKALENTIEERFGGAVMSTVLEALSDGSVSVAFGGTDLVETPLEAAEFKLWINGDEQQLTAIGSATVGAKKYDGEVYLNSEQLVASSAAFFGSTDLGIVFDTLESDLKNSIFRDNSGTVFGVLGATAAQDLVSFKEGLFDLYSMADEWAELSDEIIETFLEIMVEHALCKRYAKDGRIYVSATVDNDALSRTLRDTRAIMVKDRGFCRELRRMAEIRDSMASRNSNVTTEWRDKVEKFISSSADIDALCDTIDSMAAFALQLDAAVIRSSDVIETATLSFRMADADIFSFALDLSAENTNIITLSAGGFTRELSYTVTKDSLRHYHADMVYKKSAPGSDDPLIYVTGELNADRKADSFTLVLRNGEEVRSFSGSFDTRIDGFDMAIHTVTLNGEAKRFSFSFAVDVDDTPPSAPEDYTNIATITQPRFAPIALTAGTAYVELKSAWGDTEISTRSVFNLFFATFGIDEEIPAEES